MKTRKTWYQARWLMLAGGVTVFYRFGGYANGGYPSSVNVGDVNFVFRRMS